MTPTPDKRERVARAIREHIKVDASGLAPAVVGHFIFGFEEAADAAIAEMERDDERPTHAD